MRVPKKCLSWRCEEEGEKWLMINVSRWCWKLLFLLYIHTWLYESNIENLIHLTIVSCDVEDAFGWVLDASDVDRHQILGDLLPFHLSGTARSHMEHFRPQPKYTNYI